MTLRTALSADDRRDSRTPGDVAAFWLVPLLPALAALAVNLWALDRPSMWRDESATLSAAGRSVPDLLRMLGEIDAVHGLYYLLMNPVLHVFGSDPWVARLPSVIAAAVAAGMTTVLGRRLAGTRVGLIAGLLVAGSAAISRYAQESRQYTFTTAGAVLATYLLVRALDRNSWRAFAGYGAMVAVIGYIHFFTLLIMLPHLVVVLLARGDRRVLRWFVAAGGALVTLVPLVLLATGQRDAQLGWLLPPSWQDVGNLLGELAGAPTVIVPVILLCLGALWGKPNEGRVDARWLALSWTVLPSLTLLLASHVQPNYHPRYLLFCVPAVALLTALGLRRFPWWLAGALTVALIASNIPAQIESRQATARADDLRTIAQTIERGKRPGDAVVFHWARNRRWMSAYPECWAGLWDLARARSAAESASLDGDEVDEATLLRRLKSAKRVWYVHRRVPDGTPAENIDEAKNELVRKSGLFRKEGQWFYKGGWVGLYVRKEPKKRRL